MSRSLAETFLPGSPKCFLAHLNRPCCPNKLALDHPPFGGSTVHSLMRMRLMTFNGVRLHVFSAFLELFKNSA